MQEINNLVKILDTLLAPDGCPWDQKQTLVTIRMDLLEEACELIDAIESRNKEDIQEELGDVLFVVLFLLRLAEKEKIGTVKDIVSTICEKLIRRHPHIFEEKKDLTDDELLIQWDAIKKQEKKVLNHPLDRIPKALPSLSKASEILKAAEKHHWERPEMNDSDSDMALGNSIFELVERAHLQGIDPEVAFRKYLAKYGEILRTR